MSRHLRILHEAGFVDVRAEGQKHIYFLRQWEARLARFDTELERRQRTRGARRKGDTEMTKKREHGRGKSENNAPKITTFLTFDNRAEEAVNLYVSTFKNSRIVSLVRGDKESAVAKGKLLNATFELNGQPFMAMDGGPYFSFAQGTSLFVNCETQEEIDRLWETLSKGGEKQPCGWLKDKFGVSWQIVPSVLGEMMGDPKSGNSQKVMEALLKMSKIDIYTLEKAYAQKK